MSKIIVPHRAAEQLRASNDFTKALGHLQTVSSMVLHGAIDTDGAMRDGVTGAYLLPYEGSTELAQRGFLVLPHDYKVNKTGDTNAMLNPEPTYSYIGLQNRWFNFGKTVLDLHSRRSDVVIASVPTRPLMLAGALRRTEWIHDAATAGQVAVVRGAEIIGDDERPGTFQPAVMDLFLRSTRAALAVAATNGMMIPIPQRSVAS